MVELSWLTIISLIIWVAATTWYLTRKRSAGTIEKLHAINASLEDGIKDLGKALSEKYNEHEALNKTYLYVEREWQDTLAEADGLYKQVEQLEAKVIDLEKKNHSLELQMKAQEKRTTELTKENGRLVNLVRAKDRENIIKTETIFRLESSIKHYKLKMKKLYSEPNNADDYENIDVWAIYDEVIQLSDNKKGPDAATSEPTTINRGLLRLQA